jgi:NTE family protein
MTCKRFLTLAFLLLTVSLTALAQQRPKVGLCLSGGGAKGLAHIGLLRIIDSVGIKVDYITGTSMGGIVGALYSMGYSGSDLKKIAALIDWSAAVKNKVPLRGINVEEKDEYGRYIIEMPIKKFIPTLPIGLVEGQALQKILTTLTFPAYKITNFDSLPIPFHCIAADIKTGQAVVLRDGNLMEAIRASVAIPLIFTPVEKDNMLLVDGGLVRNFPVQDVKEMGADIVIGSYTGFKVYDPDDVNDMYKIFSQTQSFRFTDEAAEQIKQCDILVNYELSKYGAGAFQSYRKIIEVGEAQARQMLPELIKLAEKQKKYPPGPERRVILNNFTDSLLITQLQVDNRDPALEPLVYSKLSIDTDKKYPYSEIQQRIDNIYGTRFFDKVYYTLLPDSNDGTRLTVKTLAPRPGAFKFALHYDNELAAGILLNVTYRNLLLKRSRIMATFDLAELPKGRFNYYKFVGPNENYWLSANVDAEYIRLNDFIYNSAQSRLKFYNEFFQATLSLNRTVHKNAYFYLDARRDYSNFYPQVNPRNLPFPPPLAITQFKYSNLSNGFGFLQNSLNQVQFPDRGNLFKTETRLVWWQQNVTNAYIYDYNTEKGMEVRNLYSSPTYFRFYAEEEHIHRLSRHLSLIESGFWGGGVPITGSKNGQLVGGVVQPDNPDPFFLGGAEKRFRENFIPFAGLPTGRKAYGQMISLGIAAQYSPIDFLYIIPRFNIAAYSDYFGDFYTHLFEPNFEDDQTKPVGHVYGGGLQVGVKTPIGPISAMISKNNQEDRVYYYFSFGFKM